MSKDETVDRVKAAVDAKTDKDFVLMTRSNACEAPRGLANNAFSRARLDAIDKALREGPASAGNLPDRSGGMDQKKGGCVPPLVLAPVFKPPETRAPHARMAPASAQGRAFPDRGRPWAAGVSGGS